MNKVILVGRLTRDAEVRYSQGDASTAVATFTMAVDRRFKKDSNDQTADFIGCKAFGKTAEFMERFGRKGTKFVLEGITFHPRFIKNFSKASLSSTTFLAQSE